MQNNKLIPISIIILAFGILFSSIYLGYSIQKIPNTESLNSSVLTISEVSKYLRMTEEEVEGIIDIEQFMLQSTGSYTGVMFPYFKVNDKYYFYKDQVDEWIKDVSIQHKEYDMKKHIVF